MKYIDAEKLKAEIERRIAAYKKNFDKADNKLERLSIDGRIASLIELLPFIDSLQQEQPEVDLEKEIRFFLTNAIKMNKGQWRGEYHLGEIVIRAIAYRFYEIGLNTRKEE